MVCLLKLWEEVRDKNEAEQHRNQGVGGVDESRCLYVVAIQCQEKRFMTRRDVLPEATPSARLPATLLG